VIRATYPVTVLLVQLDCYACTPINKHAARFAHEHLGTCTTGDVASDGITGVMSTSICIISDTVDRTVRRVVVSVTVQLVFHRQTAETENHRKTSLCSASIPGYQRDTASICYWAPCGGLLLSACACYRSISHARGALSSKPTGGRCCCQSIGRTDGRTDRRTLERYIDPAHCSAYYMRTVFVTGTQCRTNYSHSSWLENKTCQAHRI